MQTFQLKPKYYFGKNAISNLSIEIKESQYKKVLILYGGGSIKKNGVYDAIIKQLNSCKVKFCEFNGIEPNPRDTTIAQAAKYCNEQKVDLIIAAGGGSVIDASKVIATLATNSQIKNVWDYVIGKAKTKVLPIDIYSIITLAGTGSENNAGSVVTNADLCRKAGVMSPLAIPKVVFEDATYTLTLSQWQMNSGIFDCFSHLLEQYFDEKIFLWSEEMILANLQTLIRASAIYLKNKNDISARENILWTTSMSLNGITSFNSTGGDWNVHTLEHALSAKYDVTHGAGLALITPSYIEYRCAHDKWFKTKTILLGTRLFNVTTIEKTISKIVDFIKSLELPLKYTDFVEIKDIAKKDIIWLADHAQEFSSGMTQKEYVAVLSKIKI